MIITEEDWYMLKAYFEEFNFFNMKELLEQIVKGLLEKIESWDKK